MAGRVRVISNIGKWTDSTERKLDLATLQLITAVDRNAKIFAPKASRALVNSSKIIRKGIGYYAVRFGGGSVPYARIQHEGGTITPKKAKVLAWEKDGEWHYAKKVTIKGTKYLKKAGDAESRNATRYYRGI